MADAIPLEWRRGFDKRFWGQQLSWTVLQVLAPCNAVVEAVVQISDIERLVGDALDPNMCVPPERFADTTFAYQLQGHFWTVIDSVHAACLAFGMAQHLSASLSTRAMDYTYEDIGAAGGYTLYDKGKEIEHYGFGGVYDSLEEAKADYPPEKGWIHSDDGHRLFRSTRGRKIDIDSGDAIDLPDQTARDLGLFVPFGVWDVDSRTGRVELLPPWSPEDFAAAQVLLAK